MKSTKAQQEREQLHQRSAKQGDTTKVVPRASVKRNRRIQAAEGYGAPNVSYEPEGDCRAFNSVDDRVRKKAPPRSLSSDLSRNHASNHVRDLGKKIINRRTGQPGPCHCCHCPPNSTKEPIMKNPRFTRLSSESGLLVLPSCFSPPTSR